MSASTIVFTLAIVPAVGSVAKVITFDDVLRWQVAPNNTGLMATAKAIRAWPAEPHVRQLGELHVRPDRPAAV